MSKIYVIHENDAWVEPLRAAFENRRLPYEEWFLDGGSVPLDSSPPDGVFYNRMSASSHIRGHRFAPEQTAVVLAWLERHDRRVINDHRALRLEVSKVAQYAALQAHEIATPRTVATIGRDAIEEAARQFNGKPVIVKPNRGGSGRGVRRFDSPNALRDFVRSEAFEASLDGVTLVQEFIHSPDEFITRVEFIGGEFFYAVRVHTGGSFELCPADPCVIDGKTPAGGARWPRFTVTHEIDDSLRHAYEAVLRANGVEIGAFEFVTDVTGKPFTYDLNTNTNYNSDAEAAAGRYGMDTIAAFLGREFQALECS